MSFFSKQNKNKNKKLKKKYMLQPSSNKLQNRNCDNFFLESMDKYYLTMFLLKFFLIEVFLEKSLIKFFFKNHYKWFFRILKNVS